MSTTEIALSVPMQAPLPSMPSKHPIGRRMLPEELARRMRDMIVETVAADGTTTLVRGIRSAEKARKVLDGVVRLMRSEVHDPVNIGNPEEIRILDLARLVLDLTGSRSRESSGRSAGNRGRAGADPGVGFGARDAGGRGTEFGA